MSGQTFYPEFFGDSCEAVCKTIYDLYENKKYPVLIYARCSSKNFGNDEYIAPNNNEPSKMMSNMVNKRNHFMKFCQSMMLKTNEKISMKFVINLFEQRINL